MPKGGQLAESFGHNTDRSTWDTRSTLRKRQEYFGNHPKQSASVGAGNRVKSYDLGVFVDQLAEKIAFGLAILGPNVTGRPSGDVPKLRNFHADLSNDRLRSGPVFADERAPTPPLSPRRQCAGLDTRS